MPGHRYRWIRTGDTEESATTRWMRLDYAMHVVAERLRLTTRSKLHCYITNLPIAVEARLMAEVMSSHLEIEASLHRMLDDIPSIPPHLRTSPAGHCPELPDRLAVGIPALRANPTLAQDGGAGSRSAQTVLGILTIL